MADAAVVDIQTTSIATDVTNSSANNKRKRNDNDGNQTGNSKNINNNKRRKKKKGGGGKKGSHQHHNKQKRNWIENCSESISRIPSNCAAPVTCVITRVEIEEEPLMPKQVVDDVTQSEDTKHHTLGKEDDGAVAEIDCSSNNEPAESSTMPIEKSENNIARLSKSFVDTLSQEPKQPWEIATTVQVDGEEKKLFIPVKRHASANGPTKWQQQKKKQGDKKGQNYFHLPDGDNGDGKNNPYPKEAVPDKFWAQRKRLFSRYDEGIQIGGEEDPEMWYSVTPESIGLHIANRMISMINYDGQVSSDTAAGDTSNTQCVDSEKEIVIIDAFCGCGGNSIAFARLNNNKDASGRNTRVKVIAVDNNLSRLKMAANNASIYGISKEDIVLVHADAVEVVNAYKEGSRKNIQSEIPKNDETYFGFAVGGVELLPDHVDSLFLSPPWGGMDYNVNNKSGNSGFDPVKGITLESKMHDNESEVMKTNGGELLTMAANAVLSESKQEGLVVAFLPRNIDGVSFTKIATSSVKGQIELEQNVVNGKVKTVTAYLGPCVNRSLAIEEKK
mmetsp:Transcript_12344/g.18960  ORF Transcript_12344/g.18960 Transcript_12344/m.18960 type:complete len:559 (+) Transcript_12344:215-1891(+)|eukprot:CAMPEP_0201717654 /NCGR_PEP_ID=MMETSP0593-20130828/3344_1 /ASSEMBLY_ACC=CAM_ASM_000672 /TAXON_ID=267983 /ORGANISM="Skeletonema japonicum, Strain CCMP2506" /LENGTH=558 /DNA_ID=CAMNT_0048207763 /DNA_START=145 /DNA_END=1821 /DNA_ORIENTATION=+